MGHSSTRAARIYLHACGERERQLAATLDKMARRELQASHCEVHRWPIGWSAMAATTRRWHDLRTKSLASGMQKAPSLFEKGPLALVAGEGFELSTSGL
jgi:hypothetical protein